MLLRGIIGVDGRAPMAFGDAAFGEGLEFMPIWLDDVMCAGDEATLASCEHLSFGVHNCIHSEDAGVDCIPALAPATPQPQTTLTQTATSQVTTPQVTTPQVITPVSVTTLPTLGMLPSV